MDGTLSTAELNEQRLTKLRRRQWIYFGPIIAAPAAHLAVTSLNHIKTARNKRLMLIFGVLGATVASISMRMYLMAHAGYPAGEKSHTDRVLETTEEEARRIEHPTATQVLFQALKGMM